MDPSAEVQLKESSRCSERPTKGGIFIGTHHKCQQVLAIQLHMHWTFKQFYNEF